MENRKYAVKQDWQSGEWQVLNSHMEVVASFPYEADAYMWCGVKNKILYIMSSPLIKPNIESYLERSEA